MLPIPIGTTWLINRESYGPEAARKMQEDAVARFWGMDAGADPPAERNGWLIEAGNHAAILARVSSLLARFRRTPAPLTSAQQP